MRIFLTGMFLVAACGLALAERTPPTPPMPTQLAGQPNETPAQALDRTGNSLLRATASTPADSNQAKLSNISFFAVPEPQPKTLKKHDLVTIVVREEQEFKSNGTTDLKKQTDFDAKLAAYVKLVLSNYQIKAATAAGGTPELNITGQRDFKGEATVDRSDSLILRVTAEVVDVKPNGNLVLQGRQRIKHDEEELTFILSGTCRAEDILPDNTVLSTQMFDTDLSKLTKGAVRDTTKRGWFPKLLDVINPF